ncbi:hypothetical protein [Sulfolobus spindle-shaped virus]|nr:hypothetical protein [Sulfolobus spindle-shaped virus]
MAEKQRRYKFGDYLLRERKGRYYVYKLETINGEIKERYVGPLTDVVESYLKEKEGVLGGFLPLTTDPPGFEPGTTGSEGGKEREERRKIALVANLRQYASEGNIKAFYDWLLTERKVTEKTAKEYVSAISKPFRETRNSQKAYRLFAKFLASRGIISDDFAEKILKVVKVKKTNADIYIPTLEDIKRTLKIAKEYSENVYLVYRLALESGSRLSEILRILKEPERDICDVGGTPTTPLLCYYPLSWQRGYKGVFYVFHLTPLRKVDITQWAISDFERRNKDAVAIKYVRKFVASKMAEIGIPLDVIDFIQGRKPTRILTQHYVSLFGIAKEHYKKYAEWLRSNF